MAADALATQGAMPSEAMSLNIPNKQAIVSKENRIKRYQCWKMIGDGKYVS